ncbi:hypothetical protein OF83DRAFT_1089109 [Amylostereum chailletii]|nr:hypothetical protein OF83DRAFT_1089109 [Amylostereum chailletii]
MVERPQATVSLSPPTVLLPTQEFSPPSYDESVVVRGTSFTILRQRQDQSREQASEEVQGEDGTTGSQVPTVPSVGPSVSAGTSEVIELVRHTTPSPPPSPPPYVRPSSRREGPTVTNLSSQLPLMYCALHGFSIGHTVRVEEQSHDLYAGNAHHPPLSLKFPAKVCVNVNVTKTRSEQPASLIPLQTNPARRAQDICALCGDPYFVHVPQAGRTNPPSATVTFPSVLPSIPQLPIAQTAPGRVLPWTRPTVSSGGRGGVAAPPGPSTLPFLSQSRTNIPQTFSTVNLTRSGGVTRRTNNGGGQAYWFDIVLVGEAINGQATNSPASQEFTPLRAPMPGKQFAFLDQARALGLAMSLRILARNTDRAVDHLEGRLGEFMRNSNISFHTIENGFPPNPVQRPWGILICRQAPRHADLGPVLQFGSGDFSTHRLTIRNLICSADRYSQLEEGHYLIFIAPVSDYLRVSLGGASDHVCLASHLFNGFYTGDRDEPRLPVECYPDCPPGVDEPPPSPLLTELELEDFPTRDFSRSPVVTSTPLPPALSLEIPNRFLGLDLPEVTAPWHTDETRALGRWITFLNTIRDTHVSPLRISAPTVPLAAETLWQCALSLIRERGPALRIDLPAGVSMDNATFAGIHEGRPNINIGEGHGDGVLEATWRVLTQHVVELLEPYLLVSEEGRHGVALHNAMLFHTLLPDYDVLQAFGVVLRMGILWAQNISMFSPIFLLSLIQGELSLPLNPTTMLFLAAVSPDLHQRLISWPPPSTRIPSTGTQGPRLSHFQEPTLTLSKMSIFENAHVALLSRLSLGECDAITVPFQRFLLYGPHAQDIPFDEQAVVQSICRGLDFVSLGEGFAFQRFFSSPEQLVEVLQVLCDPRRRIRDWRDVLARVDIVNIQADDGRHSQVAEYRRIRERWMACLRRYLQGGEGAKWAVSFVRAVTGGDVLPLDSNIQITFKRSLQGEAASSLHLCLNSMEILLTSEVETFVSGAIPDDVSTPIAFDAYMDAILEDNSSFQIV